MFDLEKFLSALSNLGDPTVLVIIVLAATYGVFVGAIPGLTATMAVALLVPLTLALDPVEARAAIVTLEACAIFAGDIPTALIRIPGTPSSAAYADDAYALTRAGRQEHALGVSLVFSVTGGLFGALVLIFASPFLARIAGQFTTYETFWLTLLGLSCAAIVSRGSVLKGALALLVGLLLASVGQGATHSAPRLTFGIAELVPGIDFIPAMIGLFGVSEVLRNVIRPRAHLDMATATGQADDGPPGAGLLSRWLLTPLRRVFGFAFGRLLRRPVHTLRSSVIGTLVGMLPGAGADIAAWISYATSKRFARKPEEYGAGSVEGVSDATAANNSALAGAWIPALTFGIPGDSVTAIVIGVLLMKNINPGPEIFEQQGALLYSIYLIFIVANLVLIPVGFVAIRASSLIVRIPRRILLPAILLFCIVGAFAINGKYVDVWVMLALGVVGFAFESYKVPLGPVVLGIILGGQLEEAFVQNWMKSDTLMDFVSRPWAAALGMITIVVWLSPAVLMAVRHWGRRTGAR
ncbi:MAG: tripartite tricarboxylate transporter permease [Planctomycetota bacterium]|nr:tripartite tricarboxylate transporter permease [Planctomycetota bacterium]